MSSAFIHFTFFDFSKGFLKKSFITDKVISGGKQQPKGINCYVSASTMIFILSSSWLLYQHDTIPSELCVQS